MMETMLDDLAYDQTFDDIMVADQLVPLILHDYVANVAVSLVALVIHANKSLLHTVTVEQPRTSAEHAQGFSLDESQLDPYLYFGRLITVFQISYRHYCDVMKHVSTPIVGLLDALSGSYTWKAKIKPENLKKNILDVQKVLKSWWNLAQTQVDDISGQKLIPIGRLVDVLERLNIRLLSLTEFIIDSEVVY